MKDVENHIRNILEEGDVILNKLDKEITEKNVYKGYKEEASKALTGYIDSLDALLEAGER